MVNEGHVGVNESYVGSERAKLKTFAFYNLLGQWRTSQQCIPMGDIIRPCIKSASNLHTVKHQNILRKVIE